jgi:hypothetical protein
MPYKLRRKLWKHFTIVDKGFPRGVLPCLPTMTTEQKNWKLLTFASFVGIARVRDYEIGLYRKTISVTEIVS